MTEDLAAVVNLNGQHLSHDELPIVRPAKELQTEQEEMTSHSQPLARVWCLVVSSAK